jgi:hypothetical protein
MASTYSSRLKLELMETGANANTWGNNTNTNLQTVDAFTAGYLSKSVAGSSNVTLTTNNADPTAESSNKVLDLNGTLTGNITVFVPQVENNYIVYNNTSGSFTLDVAATGGTGVSIDQGTYEVVYCDGTNVLKADLGTTNASQITSGTLADARLSSNVVFTNGATFTGNVALNDNVYLNVGTGSDLLIYHDGTNSVINDNGTGNVNLRVSNTNVVAIASTGIDITGEVLADKAYIAEVALVDGATIDWDMADEAVAKVTLGGNRTLNAPTNGSTGQFASLLVIQDGTGSRTLTFNAVYEFKDDSAPTLTTTGGKGDLFTFRYNGSKWLEVGRNLNLTLS